MNFPRIPKEAKILVTGAAGFIGSHFVEMLFDGNHTGEVLLLDRLSKGGKRDNITKFLKNQNFLFLEADILDVPRYKEFLEQCEFVFHFAAESHVDRSIDNPDGFVDANVVGTYRLLEACRKFPAIRFVMISTDEVYGSNLGQPSRELDPFLPSSIYSASKAAAELLCLANFKTHNQDIVIVRSCNNFGPRQDIEKFIPTVITKILEGEAVPVYGSGENIREWIDVRENVKAIAYIGLKGPRGEAFNVGSGIRLKNLELIHLLSASLPGYDTRITFVADRKGHDARYALDSTKIEKSLGWIYSKDFQESIDETIKWFEPPVTSERNL